MACPSEVAEVPEGIRNLFIEFIKPKAVLHKFWNILSKSERDIVKKTKSDIDGACQLLEFLTKNNDWFSLLLRILRDPDVKLQHIAGMMEEEMRVFERLSQHAGQNWRTRTPASGTRTFADIYIAYNNDMFTNIHEIILSYDVAEKVVRAFPKHSENKVLTKKDIQNVQAKVQNKGENDGTQLLLERLILYEDWFCVLLKVLRDPEIGLGHVAEILEKATEDTRQKYEEDKIKTQQMYLKYFSDDNNKAFPDSTDDMQMEEGQFVISNEEYESDSPEVKTRAETLMQHHGNANCGTSESDGNLPIQTGDSGDGNSGKTKLMDAAAAGDAELLMSLISETSNIDECDSKGRTALMHAAVKGQTECIQLLIIYKCDLEKQDSNGNTALIIACGEGHTECVNILIHGQADVNVANKSGATALMVTAKKGYVDCMTLLLFDGKCDPNKPHNDGLTALMYAARHGKLECLKLLTECGCDVNKTTIKGQTALMFASGSGHSDCVKVLTDCHCKVNVCDCKKQTALMFAASNGHSKCIELLIDGGADINRTDENENTAIMFAILNRHIECVKLFVKKNADLNIVNSFGYTALRAAKKKGYSLTSEAFLRTS